MEKCSGIFSWPSQIEIYNNDILKKKSWIRPFRSSALVGKSSLPLFSHRANMDSSAIFVNGSEMSGRTRQKGQQKTHRSSGVPRTKSRFWLRDWRDGLVCSQRVSREVLHVSWLAVAMPRAMHARSGPRRQNPTVCVFFFMNRSIPV